MEKVCNDVIKGGFWWYDTSEDRYYCKADDGTLLAKITRKNLPKTAKTDSVQRLINHARRIEDGNRHQ